MALCILFGAAWSPAAYSFTDFCFEVCLQILLQNKI